MIKLFNKMINKKGKYIKRNIPYSSYSNEYHREYCMIRNKEKGKIYHSKAELHLLIELRENGLRKCYKCYKIQSINEFPKSSDKTSGYAHICKECKKEYYKEWYKINGRKRNKKSQDASNYLYREIQKNNIKKPNKCKICGKSDCRISGHHPNYGRPLKVIWVCPSCHKKIHKQRRNNGKKSKTK